MERPFVVGGQVVAFDAHLLLAHRTDDVRGGHSPPRLHSSEHQPSGRVVGVKQVRRFLHWIGRGRFSNGHQDPAMWNTSPAPTFGRQNWQGTAAAGWGDTAAAEDMRALTVVS